MAIAWKSPESGSVAIFAKPHHSIIFGRNELRGYTGHEHLDDIGIIHMNGRVYDPKLGRMLSPDPVTQAPENGQNYNRYTYANNNPLKYTDPSGFEFDDGQSSGGTEQGSSAGDIIYAIASIFDSIGGLFRNDGCDRTCKERHAALRWCEAQRGCANELYANTKKKFRRRSAQVMQEASQTGQSYYFENGRAHLGDNTVNGAPSGGAPVVGDLTDGFDDVCHGNTCQVYTVVSTGGGPILDQKTVWEGIEVWDVQIPVGEYLDGIAGIAGFIFRIPTASVSSYIYRSGTEFGHQEIEQEIFEQLWVSVITDGVTTSYEPVPGRYQSTGTTGWAPAPGGPISVRTTHQVCIQENCSSF